MKNEELDKNDITINIEKNYVNEKCNNIIKEKHIKNCPICNNIQIYSSLDSLRRALKYNSLCIKCDAIKKSKWLKEKNPFYGKLHTEKTKTAIREKRKYQRPITIEGRKKISLTHKDNKYNLGRVISSKIKEKMRNSHLGKNHGKYKYGKDHSFYGKHHTGETKYKMRISAINRLKNQGIMIAFNPNACEYIDKLNKERGWNLQHAMNGGEVELYGYFADGYDKDRNIIFEYDEPRHNNPYWKQKDIIRQNNLIENINPTIFLRYDENKKELKYIRNTI